MDSKNILKVDPKCFAGSLSNQQTVVALTKMNKLGEEQAQIRAKKWWGEELSIRNQEFDLGPIKLEIL